ncbi:hypothetical protein Esti_003120 [Eimeria stiedai]
MSVPLAVRDLGPLFFRLKAQAREKRLRFTKPTSYIQSPTARGQQRLLSFQAEDEPGSAPSKLPPRWVDALDELHDDIAHIKEKMGQLQKVQQRRLLQVFGDSMGEAAIGREVEAQTAGITQARLLPLLFRRCEVKLQQLRPQDASASHGVDRLLQQNAQKSVAAQLQGLTQVFRQQQKAYLEGKLVSDCRLESHRFQGSGFTVSGLGLPIVFAEVRRRCQGDDLLSESHEPTAASVQAGFHEEYGSELHVLEAEADVRREEVAKVAQSVAELHQMFRDTATLVIEQGTVLDRIDYNLEQVAEHAQQATAEIQKAEESRRSGRAAKCIFGLVITIFVLLVLLIMKHT